jgi:hypothetical protein
VFLFDRYAAFAILQSRAHEHFVDTFSSTLEDRQGYRPTDCFDNFPFPKDWEAKSELEGIGREYHQLRAAVMVRIDEGLTETYNRFHDPNERDTDILLLRDLHRAMDRAVLDAYGWTDIATPCDFFLEYEIDEETWGDKKKPYRYRWPDAVRDEVLARLLDLNQKRYQEEVVAGLHGKLDTAAPGGGPKAKAPRKSPKAPSKRRATPPNPTLGLFDRKKEDER